MSDDREWDPFTRSYVQRGWVAERQQLMNEYMDDWANGTGTCTLCRQPMNLHPPERAWTADPGMCPDPLPPLSPEELGS